MVSLIRLIAFLGGVIGSTSGVWGLPIPIIDARIPCVSVNGCHTGDSGQGVLTLPNSILTPPPSPQIKDAQESDIPPSIHRELHLQLHYAKSDAAEATKDTETLTFPAPHIWNLHISGKQRQLGWSLFNMQLTWMQKLERQRTMLMAWSTDVLERFGYGKISVNFGVRFHW